MFCSVKTGTVTGIESYLVKVEVNVSNGLPMVEMVGYVGQEVKEARERVRVALANIGYPIPPCKITVNLSPANIRKGGSAFDLPIAVGILLGTQNRQSKMLDETLFLGELGLDGSVKYVKGVLPTVLEAKKRGIKRCIVPRSNKSEAAIVDGLEVLGVSNLEEVLDILGIATKESAKGSRKENAKGDIKEEIKVNTKENTEESVDFLDVVGQEFLKRAAIISAAGFHHLLIVGQPGVGKSMVAKCMRTILPPMNLEECLEVTKIYSVLGVLEEGNPLITKRPFLSPHHTITKQALIGGGKTPMPGIISKAHKGVLFLDELPEFKRETLDVMRQPLEEKKVQIDRNMGSFDYPADFVLVGALNPCPCGFYPNYEKCKCGEYEIKKYLSRISGPFLDRMDMCVEANEFSVVDLKEKKKTVSSHQMLTQVMKAREMQEKRYENETIQFNGQLHSTLIDKYCVLSDSLSEKYQRIALKRKFSIRNYYRTLKVARTIADIDGENDLQEKHILEAICYKNDQIFF